MRAAKNPQLIVNQWLKAADSEIADWVAPKKGVTEAEVDSPEPVVLNQITISSLEADWTVEEAESTQLVANPVVATPN